MFDSLHSHPPLCFLQDPSSGFPFYYSATTNETVWEAPIDAFRGYVEDHGEGTGSTDGIDGDITAPSHRDDTDGRGGTWSSRRKRAMVPCYVILT